MCAYTIITMTMALVPISRLLALTIFVCKCRVFLRHFSLSHFIVHWIFLRWFVVVVVSLQNMYIIKIRTNVNDLSESNLMAVKIFLCTWLCDSLKKYQLLFLCESQWLRIYFFILLTVHSPSNEKNANPFDFLSHARAWG